MTWVALAMPSEIAKKLEKLSIVRSRIRRGFPWLKEETTEKGEQVICTNSLQWNAPILHVLLDHYGLRMQLVPELTKRVLLHQFNGFSVSINGIFWGHFLVL